MTLATMESCTGGFLANSITEVPDSAAYFRGGVVAYTNSVKIENGVPEAIIEKHGGESQQTATAMARAIREKMGADFGIGIAGMAGPSEFEGKQVGLAYLSVAGPGEVRELELRLPPRRVVIKRRSSNQALIELRKLLATG